MQKNAIETLKKKSLETVQNRSLETIPDGEVIKTDEIKQHPVQHQQFRRTSQKRKTSVRKISSHSYNNNFSMVGGKRNSISFIRKQSKSYPSRNCVSDSVVLPPSYSSRYHVRRSTLATALPKVSLPSTEFSCRVVMKFWA